MFKYLGLLCVLGLLIVNGCQTTTSTTTTTTLPTDHYTIAGTLNQGTCTYETAVVMLSKDEPSEDMDMILSTAVMGTFASSFTYSISYTTSEGEYYVFAMAPVDWDEDGVPPFMTWTLITLGASSVVNVDALTLQSFSH